MVRMLRGSVVVLATLQAGWMAIDGLRALVTGDYTTPSSGAYAGRLGPWADLFEEVGVDPRATPVKVAFVGYGLGWLGAVAGYVRGRSWGPTAMIVAAAGSLWYLVVGTVSSAVQLVLLALERRTRNVDGISG